MNLVRFEKTQLHHAFEAVRREAERYGVAVAGSEIVGLVPQAALDRGAEYFLRLENFSPELVLENRIAAALAVKRDAGTNDDKATSGDVASVVASGEGFASAITDEAVQASSVAAATRRRLPA